MPCQAGLWDTSALLADRERSCILKNLLPSRPSMIQAFAAMRTFSAPLRFLVTLATSCLLLTSCGEEETEETPSLSKAGSGNTKRAASREPAPPQDTLAEEMVGFWVADVEAMTKELKNSSQNGQTIPPNIISAIAGSLAVEIPEVGKMVVHRLGKETPSSFEGTSSDVNTRTITAKVTENGETLQGSAIIDGDSLTLEKGDRFLYLIRATEEEFRNKLKESAESRSKIRLPGGPGPGPGPAPGSQPPLPGPGN